MSADTPHAAWNYEGRVIEHLEKARLAAESLEKKLVAEHQRRVALADVIRAHWPTEQAEKIIADALSGVDPDA